MIQVKIHITESKTYYTIVEVTEYSLYSVKI